MVSYVKKHPKKASAQLSPIRPSYLRHSKSFISQPKMLSGLVVMTIVKFTAGGMGFMRAYFFGLKH